MEYDEYGFPVKPSRSVTVKLPKARKATPEAERLAREDDKLKSNEKYWRDKLKDQGSISNPAPRGMWRRFVDSLDDSLRHYGPGPLIAREAAPYVETGDGTTPQQRKQKYAQQEKDRREVAAQNDPPDSVSDYIADFAGGIGGAVLDPTSYIGGGAKQLGERIINTMGISAGADLAMQQGEKAQGVRDELDPVQAGINLVAPPVIAGAGAAVKGAGRKIKSEAAVRSIARGGDTDLDTAVGIGNKFGRVTSTVRSPEHNKKVGGVPNSYHLSGQAIDIARGKGVSHKQIERAYRRAGFEIVESLDEGDHSHLAFKFGGKKTAPDGLPGNQSVRPIDPREIAKIMGDPEAADVDEATMNEQGMVKSVVDGRWLSRDEAYDEAHQLWVDKNFPEGTEVHGYGHNIDESGNYKDPQAVRAIEDSDSEMAQARNKRDNVIELGKVRQALDDQKVSALVDEKLDSALYHEDAVLHDESPLTLEDATRNREIADKIHDMLPEGHSYKDRTLELQNIWRNVEQTLKERELHADDPIADKPDPVYNAANKHVSYQGKYGQKALSDNLITNLGSVARKNDNRPLKPGERAKPRVPLKEQITKIVKDLWDDESGSYRGPGFDEEAPKPAAEGPNVEEHPAISKLREALDKAPPLRKAQERLVSEERSKRLSKVAQTAKATSGEHGFYAELGQLKGEMPTKDFASIRDDFSQDDLDQLFDVVKNQPRLSLFDKINARTALSKLLEGKVPTESEIKLLNGAFPKDVIDGLLKKRPLSNRVNEGVANALNLPRAVMSSFDLSAPFRQGVFLVGRKEFWTSFDTMFKQWGSEKAFQAIQDEIAARPSYSLMKQAKLSLTNIDRFLEDREEAFMSDWAEKVPILGSGKLPVPVINKATGAKGVRQVELKYTPSVRASNRAYVGFLNKLRADVFDSMVRDAKEAGINFKENPKALRDIGRFINAATGRGSLGQLTQSAPLLNATFFSPRLMSSRITLLNPAYYANLDPFVRKQALKSLISFGAIATTIVGLAAAGGAQVETDPRSSDFGKIKIGNTRYDVFGGFQPYVRTAAQLIAGEKKRADGSITKLNTGKYGAETRADVVGSFLRSKESPVVSFVHNLLAGKDVVGNDVKYPQALYDLVTPLMVQDTIDVIKEQGKKGYLSMIPAMFGVGVQTYKPREKKEKKSRTEDEFGFKKEPASASEDEYGFPK